MEKALNGRNHQWISDIKADDRVQGLYLVKEKRLGSTKKGDSFISLTLCDRTGEIEARVWERAETLSGLFGEGDVLEVEGYAGSYRGQLQLTLSGLKATHEVGDPGLFQEVTPKDIPKMMASLRDILRSIKNPHVKALLERFLSDRHFVSQFKKAPAAKNFHHGYIGGLLEHTLSVCEMAQLVADHYAELDRDLLLAGAFLHDLGKIRELKFDRQIDYSDGGRLLGHLVLGVNMMEEKLAGLKDFPEDVRIRLEHLILSHHGEYEFGSPKRPKFLEAFALNLIDDLDAKIKGLARFMEKDRQEGTWTDFNRLFERYFFKGKLRMVDEKSDSKTLEDEKQRALFSP